MQSRPKIDRTAYDNADFIPDGPTYWDRWQTAAEAFRAHHRRSRLDVPYGPHAREACDLFLPDGDEARGLFVFIHGGFWRMGERSLWSHLAAGPLAAGWAVAIPSYPLCPEVRISDITRSVSKALSAMAQEVPGPIILAGHSAGGHLALRMACPDVAIEPDLLERIRAIWAISPLTDLAPLIDMPMNVDLQIDDAEAMRESPLRYPAPDIDVFLLVGAEERPAFVDQALWQADAWPEAELSIRAGTHHFDIIEALETGDDPLLHRVLRESG